MKESLINISDFNNEWNRSVLDMAWKERDAVFVGPTSRKHREAVATETPSHSPVEPAASDRNKENIAR